MQNIETLDLDDPRGKISRQGFDICYFPPPTQRAYIHICME